MLPLVPAHTIVKPTGNYGNKGNEYNEHSCGKRLATKQTACSANLTTNKTLIGSKCPVISGTVPDLGALFLVPEGT